MKNKYLCILVAIMLYACGASEDVTPSGLEQNMFSSSDFSSPEEMTIRQNFRDETGIYLIFNDSLCWREVQTPQGIYRRCEMLNLNYELSAMLSDTFRYTLLDDIQVKQRMADFLKDEILPMLPKVMYPYSFFVVDEFYFSENRGWAGNLPFVLTAAWACYQATIVGTNDQFDLSATERYNYKRQLMRGILLRTYDLLDEKVYADFYAFCESMYGEYQSYEEAPMELGFLDAYSMFDWYQKEEDIKGYIYEIFSMTEEAFKEKYAAWPIVLQKQEVLVEALEKNGVTVY